MGELANIFTNIFYILIGYVSTNSVASLNTTHRTGARKARATEI